MYELSNAISLFHKREATEQGGLLSGKDPSAVNPSDPLRLWIIQIAVIITTATLLALVLRKIRQPKVIAEVLGGILLGPTAFGRIPGFSQHIFPDGGKPYLTLVANIGLCLFLFLVGLEIDGSTIKRNVKLSATVALAGMIVPFGLGAGLSVALYNEFVKNVPLAPGAEPVKFAHFMLFVSVAFSITAFPVLCRILTELKLLDTTVGVVVLSAGVGNDIVGWILLALSVALVNAGSGLTALYILLACIGWTLFLLFPVKFVLLIIARKTGSIDNGPTMFFMTLTILLVFGSAFFTDVIGVHAIFGAFVMGIIVPREGGLAIALTEKLEDMVSIIFLPLYFTLSGLSTDLGLLNNGITWAYVCAICALAFTGKFGGCTLAAHYFAGFSWRESSTIGSLMSCKGLVELIVLNVGLSAGILSQRVFSMFVLEALVLTFMTTPLVTTLYPPDKRVRVAATGANFDYVPDSETRKKAHRQSDDSASNNIKRKFTVVLDKLEHVPGMMALSQLIKPGIPVTLLADQASTPGSIPASPREDVKTSIDALRLIELSDRVSAVMKSSASETLLHTDPILAIFKMFGQLNDLTIRVRLSIVTYDDLAFAVAEQARTTNSDMILLPWLPPTMPTLDSTIHSTVESPGTPGTPRTGGHSLNPFDAFFKAQLGSSDPSPSATHSQFVRGVFSQARTDVALFVDQVGAFGGYRSAHNLFVPFFGGPDDRLALEFVAQLCENPQTTAVVLRLTKSDTKTSSQTGPPVAVINMGDKGSTAGFPDTVYGYADTHMRMQSETADNICWSKYTSPSVDQPCPTSASALSRIRFQELVTPLPLHAAIKEAGEQLKNSGTIVVTGRSRRLAVENHTQELKQLMEDNQSVSGDVKKTIGDTATAFVVASCGTGVVVVQSYIQADD